jgi:hypothetical protein
VTRHDRTGTTAKYHIRDRQKADLSPTLVGYLLLDIYKYLSTEAWNSLDSHLQRAYKARTRSVEVPMRSSLSALLFAFVLAALSATAQQSSSPPAQAAPQRDPQAIALLQQTIATMATTAPTDSSASGSVTVVEGSTTLNGSIQILTLGTTQTAETLTLPDGQRAVVYSNGDAKEVTGSQSVNPPLQLIVTDQCPDFPLPLVLSALNNSDESFQYVGTETLNGGPAQHVRVWNTFASKPPLQGLASFSTTDFWLDPSSGLPLKIAYSRRAGGGAVPAIPVAVSFSNYTNVNGVLYPFQINKSFNGTPWQTITIQSVSFNTGLTAAQFQVE